MDQSLVSAALSGIYPKRGISPALIAWEGYLLDAAPDLRETGVSPDLARTFAALAPLVGGASPDDRAFGDDLAAMLATLVRFDHVVVFGYAGDERPVCLFDTFDAAQYDVFVAQYEVGPYLLDPFYRAMRERRGGLHRMRDLAPDRFFSSEYVRSYYARTRLAEEIGFFVPIDGADGVVVSLMRAEARGAFPAREIATLKAVEPVVTALVLAQWSDLPRRFARPRSGTDAGRRGARTRTVETVWTDLNLTAREAGVVDLVLRGYSSESIAAMLGISTGTVKVHRRNVYRKLNITSQTQLLSIYLDRVSRR